MSNDQLDLVWKALSDPTRRGLLDLLRERPRTTGELCSAFSDLSRFAVMKHLGVLERAGLVVERRQGRQCWHHLNAVPLRRIYERWVSEYASGWAGSLLELKRQAEYTDSLTKEQTMDNSSTAQRSGSLHIEQELVIEAEPEAVFDALTGNVGRWWSHSFSASPNAITLEAEPGGRFYEQFGGEESGGALYATVTRIKSGRTLDLSGPMGMAAPVVNFVTFDLEPRGDATLLKLSHRTLGDVDDRTRASYTAGWGELLNERLKPFVESKR
jgi:DNA-binding transcriptional ArsR family regulator/uncharacterized protein YndB with AHSA1/START domain